MFKAILFCAVIVLAACTDTGDDAGLQGNHVWKTQTDMIDKARDVEGVLMDGSQRQRQLIDEQAR
ncbi:MAG: hypothetical protein OEN52_06280 [Gammaproteobacteria bacterium]|nr:hypothetical protein [Gammaproteobacteria bacterium]MDH3560543.1 hypothetical protein [Gammaproteobacteria bacterium]